MALEDAPLQATLSTTWDVLGPFPFHAREQHMLSPSFPLDLRNGPYVDTDTTYPSSYADNGAVSWSTTTLSEDGSLKVSFPSIRWKALRATEGWAALQHHALLHGTLTVPEDATHHRLLVNLIQGSYFTILPRGKSGLEPQWYAGNIYDLTASQPQNVPIEPGEYDVWVAGDYEIRLFGDPGDGIPVQSLRLTVELESITEPSVQAVPTHHVYPDFLDGLAFGEAIGLGVRSVSGCWSVADVALESSITGLSLVLPNANLAPSQTRIIPIRLSQTSPLPQDVQSLSITLTLQREELIGGDHIQSSHDRDLYGPLTAETTTLTFFIPVVNFAKPLTEPGKYIKATYLYSGTMPTAFYAIPPASGSLKLKGPVLLALHGAGVDILSTTFWQEALPRVDKHWTVVPSGRTSWGLDWHGPSALDAWRSVDSLATILKARGITAQANPRALLIGHSNGGQGAWYLASRFPDRVVGVVAAAAYIKSQAYVGLGMGRGAHYADPALNGILDASFAADDNDLFLTNLADIPIYAVHGGADENVSVWHTRELVSTLKTLNPRADVTYREDPGQPHWYEGIFDERVDAFIERALSASPSSAPETFTLTIASPTESGSLHGWAVEELAVPGRLAKLTVVRTAQERAEATTQGRADVQTQNIIAFSIDKDTFEQLREITVNGKEVELNALAKDTTRARLELKNKEWDQDDERHPRQPIRAQSILSTTPGPIKLLVPSLADGSPELSLALRIAHDLDSYHKLDAEIIKGRPDDRGNLVAIQVGKPSDAFYRLLRDDNAVLLPSDEGVCFRGRDDYKIHRPGTGVIALDPSVVDGRTRLYMYAADVAGLERLGRLFPIRTGVKVPGWMVVGPEMDTKSSGGILGAGFFGTEEKWNEGMSWFSE
ncbi:hypothetical protein K523DRAFT_368134 [Schizophyllum commune Tattone D]|nr:hypothetical protein K523DRAFT_368134 [Schizophyllum commune Tattone D]